MRGIRLRLLFFFMVGSINPDDPYNIRRDDPVRMAGSSERVLPHMFFLVLRDNKSIEKGRRYDSRESR
jgi:hypothetical protein